MEGGILCPLEEIITESPGRDIFLRKGSLLFSKGSSAREVYFLKEGSVKLLRRHRDGRELIIKYIKKGCLCCIPAFNGGRFLMDAITAEDSLLRVTALEVFREYMFSRLDIIAPSIITCLVKRLQELMDTVEGLVFLDVSERLARILLRLSSDSDFIRFTHEELASMAGTVREVVSRTMADFRKRGIIKESNIRGFRINRERLLVFKECD